MSIIQFFLFFFFFSHMFTVINGLNIILFLVCKYTEREKEREREKFAEKLLVKKSGTFSVIEISRVINKRNDG